MKYLPCVLLLTAFAAGCVPNRIFYANDHDADGRITSLQSVLGPNADLKTPLAVIEFGDQGNQRDPTQVQAAKDLIRRTPKPLLVVFVHGWHNNPTTYPSQFQRLLNTLADSPYVTREQGYQVIGVYIGWRGKETDDFLYEYGRTFWPIYDRADRLGRSADCLGAIADVIKAAREQNPQARTFLIGHSFGGVVLQQAIVQSVVNTHANGQALPPADLTLLLNPASESEQTRETVERLRSNTAVSGNRQQLPVFVSLTSETDDATGGWFPAGKTLALPGKRFDDFPVVGGGTVSGKYFFTHTPGHNDYLLSHHTGQPETSKLVYGSAFEDNLRLPINAARPSFKTADEQTGACTQWNFERVISDPTPYWVVRVDRRIMNGHNDIFNARAIAMMAAIYRLNHQLHERTRQPVRLEKTAALDHRAALPALDQVQAATQQARQTSPQAAPPAAAVVPPAAQAR